MKKILLSIFSLSLFLPIATHALTMTDAEAKRQLALEAYNLETYGNPYGKSNKFEELYDPTGKPWWMIQLAKEAWSMETYGNPFGYFIPQKILVQPQIVAVPKPQNAPVPIPVVSEPQTVAISQPSEPQPVGAAIPEEIVTPYFVGTPYKTASGYAVQFSEPLATLDPHQMIYRFYCSDLGLNLPTFAVEDHAAYVTSTQNGVTVSVRPASTIRGVDTSSLWTGLHTCAFRFNLPSGTIESENVTFTL